MDNYTEDLHLHFDQLDPRRASRTLRQQVKSLLNGACLYCGARPSHLTVDHIVPRSQGGKTERSNLAPACARCNNRKGSEDVWSWWRSQSFWSEENEHQLHMIIGGMTPCNLPIPTQQEDNAA